ncbi:hypothetical protein EJB05_16814 [Eragrostis curvula]|uniref:Uncharacterized protein n=1 Tax=Eragrostis curvula TaxID=38414 RepID=A0A5J9VG61_9POAL|nr:hypothetical protein EJB05_16814 [Eragrostis curvula]
MRRWRHTYLEAGEEDEWEKTQQGFCKKSESCGLGFPTTRRARTAMQSRTREEEAGGGGGPCARRQA